MSTTHILLFIFVMKCRIHTGLVFNLFSLKFLSQSYSSLCLQFDTFIVFLLYSLFHVFLMDEIIKINDSFFCEGSFVYLYSLLQITF